jgi:3-methyladenine DNA glycosylase AlkD
MVMDIAFPISDSLRRCVDDIIVLVDAPIKIFWRQLERGLAMPHDADVKAVMQSLKAVASAKARADMAPRYGIVTAKAFGVPMAKMQQVAKRLGRNHKLAAALWETGWYEARMVACMIDDPAAVTPAQMDRWRADFDNWAIVDTVFKLFDQVPHAFRKVNEWAALEDEFGRRAAFALLASAALHGRGRCRFHERPVTD